MRVYLSARTSRRDEMRNWAEELIEDDHEVVSRWIWQTDGDGSDVAQRAEQDLADVRQADALVVRSEADGRRGRGGRHVELGIALAHDLHVVRVGPSEHVFHDLDAVVAVPDWPAARASLKTDHRPAGSGRPT